MTFARQFPLESTVLLPTFVRIAAGPHLLVVGDSSLPILPVSEITILDCVHISVGILKSGSVGVGVVHVGTIACVLMIVQFKRLILISVFASGSGGTRVVVVRGVLVMVVLMMGLVGSVVLE
jgi:hypothetical protein